MLKFSGKVKEQERGVVINRSKDRRETKWGTSHGHGLDFSQLNIRGSVRFRPLVSGLVGLSHS